VKKLEPKAPTIGEKDQTAINDAYKEDSANLPEPPVLMIPTHQPKPRSIAEGVKQL